MSIDSIGATAPARNAERNAADTGLTQSAARAAGSNGTAPATALETSSAVKGSAPVPTLDQVSKAVSELNQSKQAQAQGLEFSIDQDSKRTVVKVVDQTTKEVLRQIPSVEVLEIAKSLDSAKGLLLKQTA
jgi:flagellar protein FlaG